MLGGVLRSSQSFINHRRTAFRRLACAFCVVVLAPGVGTLAAELYGTRSVSSDSSLATRTSSPVTRAGDEQATTFPSLSIRLDSTVYQPLKPMTVTGSLRPGSEAAVVDLYVVVRVPTGQLFCCNWTELWYQGSY